MFSRSNFPGLVCLALGLVAWSCVAFGCCSMMDDSGAVSHNMPPECAPVVEPPSVTIEVVKELQAKVKALEQVSDAIVLEQERQTLQLSRQADAHAANLANVSDRITQTEFALSQAVERVSDLERYAADTKPHLPLAPKAETLEPIAPPPHLVEPVAVIPKSAPQLEFAGVQIVAYPGVGCLPCLKWEREDKPKLEQLGARIEVKPESTGAPGYPWFEIKHNGKPLPIHRGRLYVETLRGLLKPAR